MKDDRLAKVAAFERTQEQIPPGNWIAIRLDGRGFTNLTHETYPFEAPFDDEFSRMMIETTRHLMKDTGFNVIYGYTESDEISLLLAFDDTTFNRREHKIISILAGEASGRFSQLLSEYVDKNDMGVFDARLIVMPSADWVADYFLSRYIDAARNSINSWAYWTLRDHGFSPARATSRLKNTDFAAKNEILFEYGINFNDVPVWQKRGSSLRWGNYEKEGINPINGQTVMVQRRGLLLDQELPLGNDEYRQYVLRVIAESLEDPVG